MTTQNLSGIMLCVVLADILVFWLWKLSKEVDIILLFIN